MEARPYILLGVDPATTLGWATYEHLGRGKAPRIQCGTFRAQGDNEAAVFADFARKFRDLLDEVQPRRAAIEARMPSFAGGEWEDDPDALVPGRMQRKQIRNEANVKRQDGIRAIMLAQFGARRASIGLPSGIPCEEVSSRSWRASFFGKGTKPPASVKPEKRRAWWKSEAKIKALMLGERWGFHVPNVDAAEAVGIVMWLAAREHHLQARDDLLARAVA